HTMPDIAIRLGVLALVGLAIWLLSRVGRNFVERRRRQALAAAPLAASVTHSTPASDPSSVRILAFSSADCRQCHQLQAPALARVQQARGAAVTVMEIDATSEHDLTQAYHILTVPSTVVLDAHGKAHAVNYGFANAQRLLAQVDTVLCTTTHAEAS
ncbi:MAG: thioredoxin family protein, partial [Ktedonobacteraceae bacterium]|nr:thioredoxin family protein [Ktedonobacteraceae bacterium]